MNDLSQEQTSSPPIKAQHRLMCFVHTRYLVAKNRLSRRSQELRVCDCALCVLPSLSPTHCISADKPSVRPTHLNSHFSTLVP